MYSIGCTLVYTSLLPNFNHHILCVAPCVTSQLTAHDMIPQNQQLRDVIL